MHTSPLLTNPSGTTCLTTQFSFLSFLFPPNPFLSLLNQSSLLSARIRDQSPTHGMQALSYIFNPLSFYESLPLPPQFSVDTHSYPSIIS